MWNANSKEIRGVNMRSGKRVYIVRAYDAEGMQTHNTTVKTWEQAEATLATYPGVDITGPYTR